MANLGAHGADGSVSAASIAVPAGGASAISLAQRVVIALGAWLGIYTASNTVAAVFTFTPPASQRFFP